jgi:hypothetical protein
MQWLFLKSGWEFDLKMHKLTVKVDWSCSLMLWLYQEYVDKWSSCVFLKFNEIKKQVYNDNCGHCSSKCLKSIIINEKVYNTVNLLLEQTNQWKYQANVWKDILCLNSVQRFSNILTMVSTFYIKFINTINTCTYFETTKHKAIKRYLKLSIFIIGINVRQLQIYRNTFITVSTLFGLRKNETCLIYQI